MQQVFDKEKSELSLKNLILQLWQRKLFILSVTFLFAVAGVLLALSMPNKYKAEAMLIPSEQGQGGGLSALANQFGGLAGMAGINLAGNSSKKPQIALQLLTSKSFLIDFIKRHKLEVLIFASKEWDVETDTIIIDE